MVLFLADATCLRVGYGGQVAKLIPSPSFLSDQLMHGFQVNLVGHAVCKKSNFGLSVISIILVRNHLVVFSGYTKSINVPCGTPDLWSSSF